MIEFEPFERKCFRKISSLPLMELYAVNRLNRIFQEYDTSLSQEDSLTLSETIVNALVTKTVTVPVFKIAFWKLLWNLHLKGKKRSQETLDDLFNGRWQTIDSFIDASDDELDSTCADFRKNIRKREFDKMDYNRKLNAMLDMDTEMNDTKKLQGLMCPRCKSNNTEYNLFQTRSGDESSTAFVYCNDCHKRWRFC